MELRSGRSRSNTPFLSSTMDKDVIITGNHVEKISKTSTTIKTYEDVVSTGSNHVKLRSKRAQRGVYRTSDYSSEEGESESPSPSQHISDNLENQFREDAFYSSNGKGSISALKVYKEAGEYWNKYPKTDYTYSRHSKDRFELAPGVIAMPNMSRRSLHSYSSSQGGYTLNKQTNTDSFISEDSLNYISATNGSGLKHRSLYSNTEQEDEDEEEKFVIRRRLYKQTSVIRRFVQVFITIFTTIFYPVYYVYNKQHSILLWLAKKLHKMSSRLMLFDTWLLRGSNSDRKLSTIMGLCLFPLLFFAGLHILLANDLTLAFPCHPHCGSIASSYYNSLIDSTISAFDEVGFAGWWLVCGLGQLLRDALYNTTIIPIEVPSIPMLSPWFTETMTESSKARGSVPVIDDNSMNALNELKAKIDIIQKQFIQSENTRKSAVSDVDNKIGDLMAKFDLLQNNLIESDENRRADWAKLLADLELKRSKDKEEIVLEMNEQRRKTFIEVEHYVFKFLKEIFGTPDHVINQEDFTKWIRLIFVAQQDLELRLTNLTRNLRNEFVTILADNEKLLMDKVTTKIIELNVQISKAKDGKTSSINFSDEHIKKLVEEALAVYDADKTGLVDFALESSGGHVISTRCTESYQVTTAVLSIFGVPISYPTNSPRTAITPGVNPGECWAFQNFPGFLVVKLSARIVVKGFTLEHISKRLSSRGKIDSALRQFEVYGLANETDSDPVLLGSYEYRDDGKPLQYFEVKSPGQIFDMVELRILSNHGNPNYTCLYRFRVHGSLSQEPT
ncbi:putative Sad1 / UNC-like protein C-terminal [Trypoxylus dichotomus]